MSSELRDILRTAMTIGVSPAHAEKVILAHLADVLGSDETRNVVADVLWNEGEERPQHLDNADAALAAVREVLGLPGGGA